jgi:heme exporter protein D
MQWNSAAEFFAMGGYGAYVWGAYAVCAVLVAAEILILLRRERAAASRAQGGIPQ